MRRLFAVLLLCSSFVLVGARPAAKATPTPTPVPTVTPANSNEPVVLVYPFQTPADLDARYGTAVAQIYAQVLTDNGGLRVLQIPQNIKQEDYTKYANAQHADYYISGYIEPIGNGAAVVSRIQDADNDIAVYSQTTQVQSVNDVGSQALAAGNIILEREGVNRPVITNVTATPTPSSTTGASYSLNNVLGDIFKGKGNKKGAAVATPTPVPKPSRAVIVTRVSGNASAGDLNSASDAFDRALGNAYTVSLSKVNVTNISKQADAMCGTNRNNTIALGTLNSSRTSGVRAHLTYKFTMVIATCFGATEYTVTESGDDHLKVVRDAVDAYVTDHPDNT